MGHLRMICWGQGISWDILFPLLNMLHSSYKNMAFSQLTKCSDALQCFLWANSIKSIRHLSLPKGSSRLLISSLKCTTILCVLIHTYIVCFCQASSGLCCVFYWLGRRSLLRGFGWWDRMFQSRTGMLSSSVGGGVASQWPMSLVFL